jgi:hypothetical protein
VKNKDKGAIAEAQAAAFFIENGYEVCLPMGDRRPYDLVIEKLGKLSRVQVKFAGKYKDGHCRAALRIMGGNQSYHTAKSYTKSEFDLLFIFTEKGERYLLQWSEITNHNEISIETSKYKKYRV